MNHKQFSTRWIMLVLVVLLSACGAPATALSPTTAPVVTQILPTPEPYPTVAVIPLPAPLQINEKIDLPYNSYELLDVYSPVSAGSWPVVIVLHGAGVTKASVSDLARSIAGLGAVVFTPSYDTNKGPAGSFEDVACAVRFGRAHASRYGGKDDRVIVVGHSLGGLAGALMMFAGDEFTGDCLTQQGSALPGRGSQPGWRLRSNSLRTNRSVSIRARRMPQDRSIHLHKPKTHPERSPFCVVGR